MASQSLLAVPPKATKSVDFAQQFSRFIVNNYDDTPAKYQEAISELNSLRESTVVRIPDKHETGLDLITRQGGGGGRAREGRCKTSVLLAVPCSHYRYYTLISGAGLFAFAETGFRVFF